MISFEERNRLMQVLKESPQDLRKEIIDQINKIDDEKALEHVLASIIKPALEQAIEELFQDRKITQGNVTGARDELLAQILKAPGTNQERLEFVAKMSKGQLFDCKKLVRTKQRHSIDDGKFFKENNKILSSIFNWFIGWAPKIAGQGVGGGEAFLILNDKDGDNSQKGDAYIGSGYNIEVKTSGGGMSEADHFPEALSVFVKEINKAGLKLTPQQVVKEGFGFSPSGSKASRLSKCLNRASLALSSLGQSDAQIAEIWNKVCKAAMPKAGQINFGPAITKGMTSPTVFKRIWAAAALDSYKATQGFDIIYVFDMATKQAQAYASGAEFLKNPCALDDQMHWSGMGGWAKQGSPRLIMKDEVSVPVSFPDVDYGELNNIAKALLYVLPKASKKPAGASSGWKNAGFSNVPAGWTAKRNPGTKKEWEAIGKKVEKIITDLEKQFFDTKSLRKEADKFFKDIAKIN